MSTCGLVGGGGGGGGNSNDPTSQSYNPSIFSHVNSPKKTYSGTVLPLFNQFLMDVVRFRVSMDIEILSYHFGIHASNISRTLKKWINVLYERLRVLVKWPEREQFYRMMPTEFKTFDKCIVIIDYLFEVFMERPSSLETSAQIWSNYKHNNTGSISFASQAWGGCVSDVYFTENSGMLNKRLPGDLILADRGFSIQDSASL